MLAFEVKVFADRPVVGDGPSRVETAEQRVCVELAQTVVEDLVTSMDKMNAGIRSSDNTRLHARFLGLIIDN